MHGLLILLGHFAVAGEEDEAGGRAKLVLHFATKRNQTCKSLELELKGNGHPSVLSILLWLEGTLSSQCSLTTKAE